MLQYPAFMTQNPWSTRIIPTSYLLPAQWPQPQNDELLLAMEEAEYEEKVCLLTLIYVTASLKLKFYANLVI